MWNQQRLAVGIVGGNQDFWQMKDKVFFFSLSSIRWMCVLNWKEKKLTGNCGNVIIVMCHNGKSWPLVMPKFGSKFTVLLNRMQSPVQCSGNLKIFEHV